MADDNQASLFNTIINDAINNDVAYICAVGKQHEFIHELADEDLAYRNAGIIKKHFPKHIVITTGNENIKSGLWSGIYASENPDTEIKQIIIADLEDFTAEALLLIKKFGEGYIPE